MEQLTQNPVLVWFVIGLVLLLAELAVPGLIVIFFGVGAWITALCCLVLDISFNTQLLIFMGTSIASLLLLRRSLQKSWWKTGSPAKEMAAQFVGRTCSVTEAIAPGPEGGKVRFNGTTWKAKAQVPVSAGQTVKIIGKDSIVLFVEPLA